MSTSNALLSQRCAHQTGPALSDDEANGLLSRLVAWTIEREGDAVVLTRTFSFPDFHRTMAFANAVAWIAHEQDHHPDMLVAYSRCTVNWSTHSVGGLSLNDFICAARVDALVA
jgi:4a-hydroxytetrahydrobiopterin dehydratase